MQKNHSLQLPEFEENLWRELEALHSETAEVGGCSQRSTGGGRNRFGRRLLAAAATVAVLAGAGAFVVSARSDTDDPADSADVRTGQDGSDPPEEPAGESEPEGGEGEGDGLPPQAQRPPDAIVHVEQVNAGGNVDHRWSDEASARSRDLQLDAAGNPVWDSGWFSMERNEDGTVTVSDWTIDHSTRTYTESEWTPMAEVDEGDWSGGVQREDDSIRQGLADGSTVEDGAEVVDGRELLRILDAGSAEACATNSSGFEVCTVPEAMNQGADEEVCMEVLMGEVPEDPAEIADQLAEAAESAEPMCVLAGELELREAEPDPSLGVTWVDPETYRPVKRLGYPGSDAEYTMTFEYLERTPENLALLEPEIPEGYSQVLP